MKTYSDFLKEELYSKEYNIHAHFIEKNNKLFIAYDNKIIDFKIHFNPNFYDVLLVAAHDLLEATIFLSNIKE